MEPYHIMFAEKKNYNVLIIVMMAWDAHQPVYTFAVAKAMF